MRGFLQDISIALKLKIVTMVINSHLYPVCNKDFFKNMFIFCYLCKVEKVLFWSQIFETHHLQMLLETFYEDQVARK